MKAAVFTKYGGPEVLQVTEVPKPFPADNQVLVKVHAVSVNDWDWGWLQGKTFVDRLMSGLFKPRKQILGSDIAGTIEAIGKNVTRFRIGDEVYGDLSGKWGGFAEYVCAHEDKLAIKPKMMSFEEAAAIPQAGMLAVQGLIDQGKIQHGQKLLINGAGGGVGTLGLQIAKTYGVHITVVDSESKLEMMRKLGADHCIDYRKQDFTKLEEQYDLVLDTKTNRSVFKYLRVLKPGGMYLTVGGSLSRIFQLFIFSRWIKLFTGKKVKLVILKTNKDLHYMNTEFEAGRLKPFIGHVFKLSEIREAFQLFEKAEHKGKIVISVAPKL